MRTNTGIVLCCIHSAMLCKRPLCIIHLYESSGIGSPLNDSWQKAPPLLSGTGCGSCLGNCEPRKRNIFGCVQYLVDLPHKAVCAAKYLISYSTSIVIDGEDWHWVLGLGVVGAVPMVVVALLEEGMVGGLMKEHTGGETNRFTSQYFTLSHTGLDVKRMETLCHNSQRMGML